METIQINSKKWVFIYLAALIFSSVGCTKDELPTEAQKGVEPEYIGPYDYQEPTRYQP